MPFRNPLSGRTRPRIFKSDNDGQLPRVHDSTHWDRQTDEAVRRRDKDESWREGDLDTVSPELRAKVVRHGRAPHVRALNKALNQHEDDYIGVHLQQHKLSKLDTNPVDHAEDVRWHDLVLPRLRAYGLGVLPNPRDPEADFVRNENLTKKRIAREEEEVAFEKGRYERAVVEHDRRVHFPDAAVAVLRAWNSKIVERENQLDSLPENPSDVREVTHLLQIEQEIDVFLVAESRFMHQVAQEAYLRQQAELDNASVETIKRSVLQRAKEESKDNASMLHQLVEDAHLRMWSPSNKNAQKYTPNARYWCLFFTKELMLKRAEVEHRKLQVSKKERALLEEQVHELQLTQQRVWQLFPHDPPATVDKAYDMYYEIQGAVKLESAKRKKENYKRIDKESRRPVVGTWIDPKKGTAHVDHFNFVDDAPPRLSSDSASGFGFDPNSVHHPYDEDVHHPYDEDVHHPYDEDVHHPGHQNPYQLDFIPHFPDDPSRHHNGESSRYQQHQNPHHNEWIPHFPDDPPDRHHTTYHTESESENEHSPFPVPPRGSSRNHTTVAGHSSGRPGLTINPNEPRGRRAMFRDPRTVTGERTV